MTRNGLESADQQLLHAIAIIVFLFLVYCAAFVFWWRQTSAPPTQSAATNLLKNARACVVLALDDGAQIVAKTKVQSIFYSTSNAALGRARARGWNAIKLPGSDENTLKQIKYLPFSLFDVGLKFATTLFVGNGSRQPDMERLRNLTDQHPDKGIIIFGDPAQPVAIFALVQNKEVRRALYELAEHQTKLPASISLNLPASQLFP
jgi:hypothetical protein